MPSGVVCMEEKEKNQILEKYKNYYNPSLARLLKFSGYDTVEVKGRGVYVYDNTGRKFLDCAGGYGVFNLGYCHPRIIKKAQSQLKLLPLSSKVFLNKPLAELSELLASVTPGKLKYSFFCNSGTEAVEGALKLARLATGKVEIISATGAFHGKTFGSLSASGRDLYKKPFEPLMPEFKQVPFGEIEPLKNSISVKTAAVILEPIQGEGGIIVPPDGYLEKVQEICRNNKIIFILDEIQTGLGRCGKLFASQIYNLEPDILILAKALGGGVMPIGAFIGTEAVWEPLKKSPLIHTSTFGGNPLACACAFEAVKTIIEEKLSERAEESGACLKEKLKSLEKKFPEIVKEVRGKGLMLGIEMTKEGYAGAVMFELSKIGVIGLYTLNMPKVIRIEPPLIVEKKHLDKIYKSFQKALKKTKETFLRRDSNALH